MLILQAMGLSDDKGCSRSGISSLTGSLSSVRTMKSITFLPCNRKGAVKLVTCTAKGQKRYMLGYLGSECGHVVFCEGSESPAH